MRILDFFKSQSSFQDLVRGGKIKQVEKAIKKGVSQSELDNCIGYAIHSGLSMVKLLFKDGANINQPNEAGRTPLLNAADCGYVNILRFLLENGAKVNPLDKHGDTLLDLSYQTSFEQGFLEIRDISVKSSKLDEEGFNKKEIEKILKHFGGVSGHDMDPQFRARLQSRIPQLVFLARVEFPSLDVN